MIEILNVGVLDRIQSKLRKPSGIQMDTSQPSVRVSTIRKYHPIGQKGSALEVIMTKLVPFWTCDLLEFYTIVRAFLSQKMAACGTMTILERWGVLSTISRRSHRDTYSPSSRMFLLQSSRFCLYYFREVMSASAN